MPELTTAQKLGKYYAELRATDIPTHVVDDLVRDAAHEHVADNGLWVIA